MLRRSIGAVLAAWWFAVVVGFVSEGALAETWPACVKIAHGSGGLAPGPVSR
jgi:hypothetical protein